MQGPSAGACPRDLPRGFGPPGQESSGEVVEETLLVGNSNRLLVFAKPALCHYHVPGWPRHIALNKQFKETRDRHMQLAREREL